MNIDLSRRSFLKLPGAGTAATALTAMGFGEAEAMVAASVRPFKLTTTTETRSVCTYCSVACGIIMYADGDVRAGETARLTHIEGDADPHHRAALPRAGGERMDRGQLGVRARQARPHHQGRARREFRRAQRRWRHRQPLDQHGVPRSLGRHQRDRLADLQDIRAASGTC